MFDRLQTAEYTPIFNITPVYGISNLRDIITTTGSGSVSNTSAGYTLTITTGTSDTATLATAERGRFTVGSAFEAGIVMSIPVPPLATQKATWGVADNNNGLYFGQDSTGIFIASLRNGTETKVYQANWNVDKLNGTGPSSFILNTSTGYMYQIRFSYNQGVAEFRVVFINPVTFEQEVVVCHRLFSALGTIVADPDLPIQAYIANGITTPSQSFTMNVRGRYYSNLGTFHPMNRLTSERRLSVATNNTTFVPTVSFQRQAIFPSGSGRNNSINVSIDSFDIITSDDAIWQLRLNSTLTGASFGPPSETPSTETCVLSDVSATAINISTGIKLMGGLASAGQKTGLSTFPVDIVLPSIQIATLCVRNITANAGTVSIVLRVHEEW